MYVGQLPHLLLNSAVEGLEFDMVSVPVWPDHPDVGPTAPSVSFSINQKARDFVKMPDKDVATYLREMEEEYTSIVKEMMAKK
ncbi:hypothetical protein M3650_06020 [Paenibacillus sp. MER TA 81-3]|uniref:hypothetical protein n=1 Tax=Paenibacillus sp. MER TA 81-3 TaxID=2939573 RepID=UPI00203D6948|nr:hypothetical protein [Paenibacillus sp. MER TA 81-3]MCM3338203.1 hypothetical protein [Paenibacillus sp. MER TA 81-3]